MNISRLSILTNIRGSMAIIEQDNAMPPKPSTSNTRLPVRSIKIVHTADMMSETKAIAIVP
jgi:hypothetical protein